MTRGMLTVEQLKARCIVDHATHCWNWQGAMSRGQPRIWTLDYARVEKRGMSGPLAAWHIAHQEPPRPGWLVYRGCQNTQCLNPAHLRQAPDKAAIGQHIRLAGTRRGTAVESRRENIAKAHAKNGITPTPDAIVLAIRAAGEAPTNYELAARFGVRHSVVSRIRLGKTRASVVAA